MSMSIAGAMQGATGTTYNFTNATNAQFRQEIQSLRHQGALSPDQSVLMMIDASGGDSVPIKGQPATASQSLSDQATHDFISTFQTQDNWMHSTPGAIGTSLLDSILQTMQAYQGKPIGDSSSGVSIKA
jgi:hypothetical protein